MSRMPDRTTAARQMLIVGLKLCNAEDELAVLPTFVQLGRYEISSFHAAACCQLYSSLP